MYIKILVLKNMCIDKLDEIVDKYNKACYRTTKIKPATVQPSTYIEYSLEHNNKDLNLRLVTV